MVKKAALPVPLTPVTLSRPPFKVSRAVSGRTALARVVKRSRRLLTAVSDQMPGPRLGRAAISSLLLTRVLWRPACPLQPLRQPGRWTDCPRVASPVDPLPHRPRVATPPAGPVLARVRRHNARLHHVRQHKCTHSCPICRATWARLLCMQRPLERWGRAVCAGANASVSASAAPRSVRRRPERMACSKRYVRLLFVAHLPRNRPFTDKF